MSNKQLLKIMEDTFPTANIPENWMESKLGSPKERDSLGHFTFLMSIEEYYKIKFSIDQMSEVTTIKQIMEIIDNSKK